MSVVSEGVHHGEDVLMDKSMASDVLSKGFEFFARWEFSPKD